MPKIKTRTIAERIIYEEHPPEYAGYPFVTLVVRGAKFPSLLMIVDNTSDKILKGYVLDKCVPNNLDENVLVSLAHDWYEIMDVPFSIEVSRKGLARYFEPVYKSIPTLGIERVVGPHPYFSLGSKHDKIKRRRRKPPKTGDQAMDNLIVQLGL